MSWDTLKTYWSTAVNTAVTNGQLEEPDNIEALNLLDRWMDAEEAADTNAATDLSSYTIANRSVSRRGNTDQRDTAHAAKRAFMHQLYGSVTYADFRQNNGVVNEII
jgi:hypothetical protein